ncbi:uncharacterized mitochondrial protein AtMg00810-like [Rutidosis leptorrhynchoides]|uniref:uncharacterized mitochondrial protein AtMg00810-like n=1 Tax=Rutidosis leptorrhynchoides TaxID=125765 RepID=UPI003A990CBD
MTDEYNALIKNGTWVLVPRPTRVNIVQSMWLFKRKLCSDGSLDRFKARLVANGKSQRPGIDCGETFSSVVKPATIRTVLSLFVSRCWPIHQLDVKNAFLHGDLSETGHNIAYLLLYVDDIILTASSTALLQQIITSLSREFAMTDIGPLDYFLGISATRNSEGMFLSQRQYALDILDRADMSHCKPCNTPVDTQSKLGPNGPPVSDPTLYRSLAGALQYLTFTRPDITYTVQQLCLFMHDAREPHFSTLKRVIRYVRGTVDNGLQLFSSPTTKLIAYSDAAWGGCSDTRRSTSGYCIFLGDNLLSCSSKRQATVSRSSTEAEYRAVANALPKLVGSVISSANFTHLSPLLH